MHRLLTVFIMAVSLVSACGGSGSSTPDTTSPPANLEIAGDYTDNYDQALSISNTLWNTGAVIQYDNDVNHAIVQNASDASWKPDHFNRIVWLAPEADGSFWFCWEALDKETLDDAVNATEQADANDLEGIGCGGFPWSKASPVVATPDLEIAGDYTDNYDQALSISNTLWNTGAVIQYDNDVNHAIVQNASDASWKPDHFNRIVWLAPEADGSFWFCWEALDKETLDDAVNATEQADANDLEGIGCGGFPWSNATPTS